MKAQQLILADAQVVTPRASQRIMSTGSVRPEKRTERRKFNSASALSAYESKREDEGYSVFMSLVSEDAIGRAVYDITLEIMP